MPSVLCIAYHFPPSGSVAGSLRSAEFVRYLPSFDWEASVLCLREDLGEEQFDDVLRVRSLLPWKRPFNLVPYGWIVPLAIAGWSVLRRKQFDVIYVSCPPFGFVPAVIWLQKISGLPLVVDFRDAWTLGPYRSSSSLEGFTQRYLFPRLERRLLRSADRLIVNTPSAVRAYLKKYPWIAGRLHYLPNGFNEEHFPECRAWMPKSEFILLHCGPFNVSGRDPKPLLTALQILRDEGVTVRLLVLGESGNELKKLAAAKGVSRQVEPLPPRNHQDALRLQQQCDALLLYQAESVSEVTAVAGKTYEYIRSAKPILAVAPGGDNLRLVEHFAGYYAAVADHKAESIAEGLRKIVKAREEGVLPEIAPPKTGFHGYFDRRALSGRLARLFNRLTDG